MNPYNVNSNPMGNAWTPQPETCLGDSLHPLTAQNIMAHASETDKPQNGEGGPFTQHKMTLEELNIHVNRITHNSYEKPSGIMEFICKVCNAVCNSKSQFDQHMNSPKHLKKAQALGCKLQENGNTDVQELVARHLNPSNVSLGSSTNEYSCVVCGIQCTGLSQYEQHMIGEKHRKKSSVKQCSIVPIMPGIKCNSEPVNSVYECTDCGIQCTGLSQYEQHMAGERHKKKSLKQCGIEPSTPDMKCNSEPINNIFECADCGIQCSGSSQYEQHMAGVRHKKKSLKRCVQGQIPCNEVKITKCNNDLIDMWENKDTKVLPLTVYKCTLCQKLFTGNIPYEMHIASDRHKRNIAREYMRKTMLEMEVDDEDMSGVDDEMMSNKIKELVANLNVIIFQADEEVIFRDGN